MLGMSSQAGDWVSFAFIIVGTILLYVWASRKLAAEDWQSARKVLIATMCVLLVFSALAVNLKFNEWLMAAGASYAPGNQALTPVPLWMMNLMLVAIAVLMLGPILANQRPSTKHHIECDQARQTQRAA